MKNKFYLILVPLIFILSSCEEHTKNSETTSQNKQEINSEYKKDVRETTTQSSSQKNTNTVLKMPIVAYNYEFKNLKGQLNSLEIKNDIYNFKNIKQPIVIITIMSTWCPPCRGQIPHFSKLQHKFKENLFVMATLVHDDISKEKLNKFVIAQKMLFYLSVTQEENLKFVNMITPKLGLNNDFPMPLTIVFVRGKYYTHYEGMIPEEMVESDINQLLHKIQN